MKEILAEIERWQEEGERVVVATVIATRRSAPRPVGSSLAISESGKLCGSVSGGCVEGDVYEQAREVLEDGEPKLLSYGISDDEAWSVGLPVRRRDRRVRRAPGDRPAARAPAAGWPGRPLHGRRRRAAGSKLLVRRERRDGRRRPGGARGACARADPRRPLPEARARGPTVFGEVYGPPPRLLVYGAVDTAEALCRAAKLLGWTTIVADARAKFATAERIPSADELLVAWPEEAFAQVAPDHSTAVVVLTHDDKFDVPALKAALETEAFYIGALGSRRNQERRRERLLEAGVDDEAFERIAGPVRARHRRRLERGDGRCRSSRRRSPSRAGRSGGPLRAVKQRIHVEVE